MSLATTPRERADFLTEVHVAVVSVADENGRGPLSVPLWYEYEPGGELSIVTGRDSRKTALIRAAGRISVCVQTHTVPYRYVSAEGPVSAASTPSTASSDPSPADPTSASSGGGSVTPLAARLRKSAQDAVERSRL